MLTLLYSPFPTLEAARAAATALLEARLVACCNLIPIAESMYWWEGKLAATPEVALLAKTPAAQADQAEALLHLQHPYTCPAILRLAAETTPEFLAWATTQADSTKKH